MRLRDVIYAPTRHAWKARLATYIALIATISLFVQVAHSWWW